jgi:hypothetical protein
MGTATKVRRKSSIDATATARRPPVMGSSTIAGG